MQQTIAVGALRRVIGIAGTQSAFADACDVAQQRVSYWLRKNLPLPAEYVLTVERLYGVSRHDLRPDIYPIDLPPFALAVGQGDPRCSCNRTEQLQPGGGRK